MAEKTYTLKNRLFIFIVCVNPLFFISLTHGLTGGMPVFCSRTQILSAYVGKSLRCSSSFCWPDSMVIFFVLLYLKVRHPSRERDHLWAEHWHRALCGPRLALWECRSHPPLPAHLWHESGVPWHQEDLLFWRLSKVSACRRTDGVCKHDFVKFAQLNDAASPLEIKLPIH